MCRSSCLIRQDLDEGSLFPVGAHGKRKPRKEQREEVRHMTKVAMCYINCGSVTAAGFHERRERLFPEIVGTWQLAELVGDRSNFDFLFF